MKMFLNQGKIARRNIMTPAFKVNKRSAVAYQAHPFMYTVAALVVGFISMYSARPSPFKSRFSSVI